MLAKSIKYTLVLLGLVAIAACSKAKEPSHDPAPAPAAIAAHLNEITVKAGNAQGIFWKDMLAQSRKQKSENSKENSFGDWYSQNMGRSGAAYFDEIYEIGKANLENEVGFSALILALEVSERSNVAYEKIIEIHDLLFENYLNTPDFGYVMTKIASNSWARGGPDQVEHIAGLLGRVADNTSNSVVKDHAMLMLAQYLGTAANYMDPKQKDVIQNHRNRAKALLNQVIENAKTNPTARLFGTNLPILELYNQEFNKALGVPQDPNAKPGSQVVGPALDKAARILLQRLQTLSVGKALPPTIGQDLDGNPQNIDQYKGRVLLIDFWATWCGPCIKNMPHLIELKKKYAGRPFEILGISADDAPSDVTDFLEDMPLPWDMWFSGRYTGLVKEWGINSFPTVFLVDHEGVIIAKGLSDKKLDVLLEKLITKAEQKAE